MQGFEGTGEAPHSEAAKAESLCLHTRYLWACSMNYEGLQKQQCLQQGLIPGASLHCTLFDAKLIYSCSAVQREGCGTLHLESFICWMKIGPSLE